jgi:hypothetical protein
MAAKKRTKKVVPTPVVVPTSVVMTRAEFEATDPLRKKAEAMSFAARGLPPADRPLTTEEVEGMWKDIVRDSVGAAHRLLVEVKRLRAAR